MLVNPADVLTVSEVFNLTRFGELTLSQGGVLVQPTEIGRAGSPEAAAGAPALAAHAERVAEALAAQPTVALLRGEVSFPPTLDTDAAAAPVSSDAA